MGWGGVAWSRVRYSGVRGEVGCSGRGGTG